MGKLGLKWYEVIRTYKPNATDEECHYILWEHTAFPRTDESTTYRQIHEYFKG